jgi:hypothetical protein
MLLCLLTSEFPAASWYETSLKIIYSKLNQKIVAGAKRVYINYKYTLIS